MPTISIFYGIVIQMFWNEHAPPHFHARYGELEGSISIKELKIIEGNLPKNAVNLILKWAELYQKELLEDWELCDKRQTPKKINPLI